VVQDPWFNGLYGAAYAEGAQYDPAEPGVLKTIVTLKHWGAYSVDKYANQSGTWYRQSFDAQVSAFDMSDSYAPVFEGAVRGHTGSAVEQGASYRGALGIMCSCMCERGLVCVADFLNACKRVLHYIIVLNKMLR
jgi:hypothetical protein